MKWPAWLALVRHDVSAYNALKHRKLKSPLYKAFLKEWTEDSNSATTRALAHLVAEKFALKVSDADTPLAKKEGTYALQAGKGLRKKFGNEIPDIIFVSPYLRTQETLRHIKRGWPEIMDVEETEEDRLREQEHGLSLLYNDWRVFHALHPEQQKLRAIEGPYYYRYPQGENVPDVKARVRSWTTTLVRDFAGQKVLAITHHLTILSIRSNLERLNSREFTELDEKNKPQNCSLTLYMGNPFKGSSGKFELKSYNERLH